MGMRICPHASLCSQRHIWNQGRIAICLPAHEGQHIVCPNSPTMPTSLYKLSSPSIRLMLPQNSPLYLTDILCGFIQSCFWWHVLHAPTHLDDLPPTIPQLFLISNPSPTPPLSLNAEQVAEAELMAVITAQAFMNWSKYFCKASIPDH
jgi:hypothetical protein